jgi:hypothetical protein
MRQYSAEEIQQQLEVRGGDAFEQAAALAVVEAAILESRRLGRVAIKQEGSKWQRLRNLRNGQLGDWDTTES